METREDKPFRTIAQQIEILKSRNMGFGDPEDAKRFLLRENYCRKHYEPAAQGRLPYPRAISEYLRSR